MSPVTISIFAITAAVGFAGTMAILSHIDKKKKVIETTSTEKEDVESEAKVEKSVSVFISTPFSGLDDSVIEQNIEAAKKEAAERVKTLENDENLKIEFVHNFKKTTDGDGKKPCQLIAEAISKMADCDYVYFTNGWEDSEGCKIEQEIANRYGMQRIYSY